MATFGVMGIIANIRERFRRPRRGDAFPIYTGTLPIHDFARSEVLECQKMISDRLTNMVFVGDKDFIALRDIWEFVKINTLQIMRRVFNDGYCIIDVGKMDFLRQRSGSAVRTDGHMVIDTPPGCVAVMSDVFRATGKPEAWFLADKLKFLNIINSADLSLIENYGAMGIISPETDNSVAGGFLSEAEIKVLQDRYTSLYGVTSGKWSMLFAPKPLKYSQISLPISELQLSDKRLYVLKAIYAAFGIPKELSPYFSDATYENRRQAELDFYSGAIKKWAELLLLTARRMYDVRRLSETYLLPCEQWYEFRGVYVLEEARKTEREAAREELKFWDELKIADPSLSGLADKRISDIAENL